MAPQEKFSFWPYNKSLTKVVRSRWLDIGFSFFCLLVYTQGIAKASTSRVPRRLSWCDFLLAQCISRWSEMSSVSSPRGGRWGGGGVSEAKRRMTFQTNFQGNCRLLLCRFQLYTGGLGIFPYARE